MTEKEKGMELGKVQTEYINLERFRLCFKEHISNCYLQDAEIEKVVDDFSDSLIIQLRGYLLGKQYDVRHFYMPTSWWQHFKKECMPSWFLKRYPVQEEKIQVSVVKVCPHIDIKFDENSQIHLNYLKEKP